MKNIVITIVLLVGCYNNLLSQTTSFKKDTLYYTICAGTLDNGRPVVSEVLFKDLSFFKQIQTNDQDKFLCSLFRTSTLFIDPFITLTGNRSLYKFADDKQAMNFFESQAKAISKLNKSFQEFRTYKFSNGKRINISVCQIAAEFWVKQIDSKFDNLSPLSESFYVGRECYSSDYLLHLKQLNSILLLTKSDIDILSTFLQPVKKSHR